MTPSSEYGITIMRADILVGCQYATFEIRTDALGGFERYRWQSGGSAALLWRTSGGNETLLASGDDVATAMAELLQRIHAVEPRKLTYREFQILIDGWVEGNRRHQ